MSIDPLAAFLGWSLVINSGILLVSVLAILSLRWTIARIHSRLFGIKEEDAVLVYFKFIAYYKLAIIVFNVVPYIAINIVASTA